MNKLFLLAAAVAAFATTACNRPDLSSPKGKGSYAIGLQIARTMKNQGIEVDPATLAAGIADTLAGKSPRMTEDEVRTALQNLSTSNAAGPGKESPVAAENTAKGKVYLDANKAKPGVVVTASGLQYKIIKPGAGGSPTAASTAKVHYRGTLIDGTEFDSSYKRGKPAEFGVGQVIRGWTEALQLMKRGAKYELTIPSELAYGPRDTGTIPANSVLNFEVELIDFK